MRLSDGALDAGLCGGLWKAFWVWGEGGWVGGGGWLRGGVVVMGCCSGVGV